MMGKAMQQVKVWDLAVRIFHWSLVVFVITALVSIKMGDIQLHAISGIGTLVLVIFRLVWGVVGSENARFTYFVRSPLVAINYLKKALSGEPPQYLGHNPAGAWMIVALLGVLLLQAGLGLFTSEDDHLFFSGPLVELIKPETSYAITELHEIIGELLPLLIVIHVAAALFYLFIKKENLILPLINGRMMVSEALSDKKPRLESLTRALIAFLVSAGLVIGVINLAPDKTLPQQRPAVE
ncbi:MAG: cytochrome b/b6 domain-containing protein, partial [Magnetococcales bacterium]|nr:cytochrome b/b6 domain-containing protein [Magnetococcales bacterium]